MVDITGSPQHTIAKMVIADRLTKEMERSYNNITSFKDILEPLIVNLKAIAANYSPTEPSEMVFKSNEFITNIYKYVPQFIISGQTGSDEKNFTDHLKDILTETYDFFHEDSEILNLLGVNSIEDIKNLTSVSNNFIDSVSSTLLSGSLGSAFIDFNMDEMNVASLLSVTEHNLYGVANVADNLANITDIATNLVTNFSDVADLEFINNMLTNIPSTLDNLFLDKLGNLNISGILDMVGLGTINDVWESFQGLYQGVIGLTDMITGGVADLLGGLGSCGCAILLSVSNIGGSLRSIANFARRAADFVGQINSTIQNVTGMIDSIGNFTHDELVSNINTMIDQIKDPELDWNQIQGFLLSNNN